MGIKAGGFEFGCVGCCLPVGGVRFIGKSYSYVGRQVSPSLSIGARARLV